MSCNEENERHNLEFTNSDRLNCLGDKCPFSYGTIGPCVVQPPAVYQK